MTKQRKTKLVRDGYQDRIPPEEWIRLPSGGKRHLKKLKHKLDEEVDELKKSAYLSAEEYADIIEVLKCLAFYHNVDWADIEDCVFAKQAKYGKFLGGILLTNIPEKKDEDD